MFYILNINICARAGFLVQNVKYEAHRSGLPTVPYVYTVSYEQVASIALSSADNLLKDADPDPMHAYFCIGVLKIWR